MDPMDRLSLLDIHCQYQSQSYKFRNFQFASAINSNSKVVLHIGALGLSIVGRFDCVHNKIIEISFGGKLGLCACNCFEMKAL